MNYNSNVRTEIYIKNVSVLYKDLTPKEILEYLENGALYRGFANMVKKVYPDDDVEKILVKKLADITGGNQDSIRKNVSNWFADKNLPQREQLFQICFALELDPERANTLIAYASDVGIHYRNPEEVIYAYCLKYGKTYADAVRLCGELLPLCGDYKNPKASVDNVRYTRIMKQEVNGNIKTEEELADFIRDNAAHFGEMHVAAYRDFLKMLSYLQDPDKDYSDTYYDYMKKHKDEYSDKELEELRRHEDGLTSKSVEQVVEEFMQMHVPENTSKNKKSKRDYTYLQKAIKKNWPSENILYKMKNRDIDVSRKVMLILFLLTEEFEVSEPSGSQTAQEPWLFDDFGDEQEDANERMEIRMKQINLFLDSYGMKRLDPGNPFDFLVLYALKASYEGETDYMNERMENVLAELFGDE